MAKRTYIDGEMQTLRQVLSESNYFDSVTLDEDKTYDSMTYLSLITCTMRSGEHSATLLIGNKKVSNYTDVYDLRYENSNGINVRYYTTGENSTNTTIRRALRPTYSYQCSGGLAVSMAFPRLIITRSNNGEVLIAITSSGLPDVGTATTVDSVARTVDAYAVSDMRPVVKYTTNLNIGNQTLLIPICTSAEPGKTSYSTTAFWQTCRQYSDVCNFMYNGKRYFSDGYFAIEDN